MEGNHILQNSIGGGKESDMTERLLCVYRGKQKWVEVRVF